MRAHHVALFLALAAPIAGCDQINGLMGKKDESAAASAEKKKDKKKKASEESDSEEEEATSATASAAPSAAPTATATATATAAPDAAPSATGSAPPAAPVSPHGPVPTEDEWGKAATLNITNNKGKCETKGIRDWVRIACKEKSAGGGTPSEITLNKATTTESQTNASGGVTSLVYWFEEGTDLEYKFGWDDGTSIVYASSWPKGSKKPPRVGEFKDFKAGTSKSATSPTPTSNNNNNPRPSNTGRTVHPVRPHRK